MYEKLSKIYYKHPDKYQEECINRYDSVSSYHLPIKISGNNAFFCATNDIMQSISKIYENVNKIQKIQFALPPVAWGFCLKSFLLDEIMDTNEIEGVHSSKKEIIIALNNSKNNGKKEVKFQGIAKKYSKMSEVNVKYKNCTEIRELYNELVLPEIEINDRPDGSIFRKDSVSVYDSTGRECHQGVYPESEIICYMEQALAILNDNNIPILIRASIFHYLFGYIHPFYDGNGRTSRFISSYILNKSLNPILGYRLSYAIKHDKKKYEKAFDDCNNPKNHGDLTPFIIMFLKIIYDVTVGVKERLNSAKEKLSYYSEILDNLSDTLEMNMIEKEILFILIQNSLFENMPLDKQTIMEYLLNGKTCLTTFNKTLKNIKEVHGIPISEGTDGHKKVYSLNLDSFENYFKSRENNPED